MQPSERQRQLEALYNSRKGHLPKISISDDNYHVTEAIGSSYDDEGLAPPSARREVRPLSYMNAPSETYANKQDIVSQRNSKRQGSLFEGGMSSTEGTAAAVGSARPNPTRTGSDDKASISAVDSGSPLSVKRLENLKSDHGGIIPSQISPPPLTRQSSSDTAVQQFPLNDIDYESSPAAVAQELSNLQAIRRMSMNVDTADPDLPSFSSGFNGVPTVAPHRSEDENDTARLFWVPARLHPELAPKEFRTFIEDRVDKIRRRSGDSDSLSIDGLDRSGSVTSLRRKKSMLSHQIDTKGTYEDGADRLERKRSEGMQMEGHTQVDLSELETLVSDPAQLMRRMSLDTARKSQDSGIEVPVSEDMPILPPVGQSLKRSTRTTYRRGSLKKGERVPFSKRAQQRVSDTDGPEPNNLPPAAPGAEEPILGLTRVQTEPTPPPAVSRDQQDEFPARTDSASTRRHGLNVSHSDDDLVNTRRFEGERMEVRSEASPREQEQYQQTYPRQQRSPPPQQERSLQQPQASQDQQQQQQQQRPQQRQFQSRLASGGRTTAQLPGYNNQNPLPQIIETLPDGTTVAGPGLIQQIPERRSSHELPRAFQRGGAHTRPVPGREPQRASTLDDISSHPSPLPGIGNARTDALTMVPTFDDRKIEKKEGPRKSSWKWILGNDDDEKKSREEKTSDAAGVKYSKSGKLTKQPAEKARLDVLQNSIDGTQVSPRGRESLVLSREDVKLDDERKKESKRASEYSSSSSTKEKERDSGLLSAIFRSKKKTSDSDLKEKKRRSHDSRNLSPEPMPYHALKPDIDYNWTRFSILEERAIYRMAHIKLANPRRALYSQVLLSNFMYSYLAKVQMMHPQVQIPAVHQRHQQRGQQKEEQPAEFSQYQRWQQQQDREAANSSSANNNTHSSSDRSGIDLATGQHSSQHQRQQHQHQQPHSSFEPSDEETSGGYDTRSSEEYDYEPHASAAYPQSSPYANDTRTNGVGTAYGGDEGGGGGGGGSGGGGGHHRNANRGYTGYSVAGTHDYLGYPKDQQPFEQQGLWDDEKQEDLW